MKTMYIVWIIATVSIISSIAAIAISMSLARDTLVEKTPIEATIVGVYQDQHGDQWTTLAWGDGDRASWNNKFGKVGDKVKIYPISNGKFSISPIGD